MHFQVLPQLWVRTWTPLRASQLNWWWKHQSAQDGSANRFNSNAGLRFSSTGAKCAALKVSGAATSAPCCLQPMTVWVRRVSLRRRKCWHVWEDGWRMVTVRRLAGVAVSLTELRLIRRFICRCRVSRLFSDDTAGCKGQVIFFSSLGDSSWGSHRQRTRTYRLYMVHL